MIKKLISIKNYGTFKNYTIPAGNDWDGVFKKVNVIYGGNGKGKTTLSLIFQSLQRDDSIMLKKQYGAGSEEPSVKMVDMQNKQIKYDRGKWSKHINEIEVFNSFYLEDNTYIITYSNTYDKLNLFELPSQDIITEKKEKLRELNNKRQAIKNELGDLVYLQKTYGANYKGPKDFSRIATLKKEKSEVEQASRAVEEVINSITMNSRAQYLKRINNYLECFGAAISLTDMKLVTHCNSNVHKIVYGIIINGKEISVKDRETSNSLKYFLSEGDKNALALSFFLAKFDIIPNPSNYIIVVDDPFTSFDTNRKRATINLLARLAKKVGQLFILTHDLHFKNDFINAYRDDLLSLKILSKGNTSGLYLQNTRREVLTGLERDIETIDDFYKNPLDDQQCMRDVIRCLRPALEGIIRIKYKRVFGENEWLGDFINKIREAKTDSIFFRLKDLLDDLEEINDYSKSFHHSNPTYMETEISETELKHYCKLTQSLIEKI